MSNVPVRGRPVVPVLAAMLVATLAGSPAPVRAADGESAEAQLPQQARPQTELRTSPDFLLGAPHAWVALRGSMLFPRAGGDLFSFVTEQLTLNRSDLRARGFAGELGIVATPNVDVVGGFDLARREAGSEYRNLVASNRQAIEQRTRLNQSSISAGVRYSPLGRGRRVSRYAFLPKRFAPFAGGGITATYYTFAQRGQFVDYTDSSIFSDSFNSQGWTMGPYVNGGADVQVWKALYLTFDGRFSWLHSELGSDFTGFDGIDLAGFRGSTGISILF